MSIVSFDLEGDFAAFRDPSVTTNQTVTIVPSKSAAVGLIGALLGIKRSNSIFDDLYSEGYVNLLKNTAIGIKVRSPPMKWVFFTNHRSLKEAKTKPFKTELLMSPRYTIFVKSTNEINRALLEKLEGKNFAFSPTLGHSYCLARIPRYQKIDEAKEVQPIGKHTSTVFLDEVAESNNRNSGVEFSIPLESQAKIVVERHIHHYFKDDLIKRTVLRHLIPIPVNDGSSKVIIDSYTTPLSITKFYEIDDSGEVLCLY